MKRTALLIAGLGVFLFVQAAQAQWTTAKRITWTSGDSSTPVAAVDSSGAIHVVWSDVTPGNGEIYYKRSEDGGVTWSAVKRLSWMTMSSVNPAMAIDSEDVIHVAWQDDTLGTNELYYRRSTAGGAAWDATKRLTWTPGQSVCPALALTSDDAVHIVWSCYKPILGSYEIFYRGSTDAGLSWSPAKRLTWTSGGSHFPAVAAASGNTIQVVWHDETPGNDEIYYKKSTDGGTTWSAFKRLTWNSGDSNYPSIGIGSSGALHIAWSDNTPGSPELYYKSSVDGGTTWNPARRLTWTSEWCYSSAIALDSADTIHLVWRRDYAHDEADIYYKSSMNGGVTWSLAEDLTGNNGRSYHPAVAIDSSDALHIVWHDEIPGNFEIYYRKRN